MTEEEEKVVPEEKKPEKKKKSKNNPKFKTKKNKYGTTLRQITALLREVEIIDEACNTTGSNKKEKILDPFQQAKKDLSDKLKVIKNNIKLQKGIQTRVGNNSEAIKLKNQIKEDLEQAKQFHSELEEAYKKDKYTSEANLDDNKLSAETLKEREELVALLKQDLEFTESGYEQKSDKGRGYGLAREQRNRRTKKREENGMHAEPVPLTEKQQAWIQMTIEKDQIIDEKLDIILQDVKQLNAIGEDVNQELKKQNVILDEVEEKMDHVTERLEKRNQDMKRLLEASGGLQRWIPVVILFVILLAICGFIYNALTSN